jgi:hypothetical protein
MTRRFSLILAAMASVALAGCSSSGELVVQDGVGITAVRSACPAVGIPDYTGDITVFTDPAARDSRSIDVTASLTDVRNTCDPASAKVKSAVTFKVQARRTDPHGERDVVLPYFVTVVRGGTTVVAKRVGLATVHFADGATRAEAVAQGGALVDKSEATLPRDVHDRIVHQRKAGEADAAVDPLSDPEVRDAVERASFEVLVGFQLDDKQLAYNATR